MHPPDNLLASLESLLVKEFRAYQRLLTLKREESQALSSFTMENLSQLEENIEAHYGEIDQLQNQRQVILAKVASQFEFETQSPAINELCARLDPEASDRVNRLQEGITAIRDQIRQLTNRNAAITPPILRKPKALDSLSNNS